MACFELLGFSYGVTVLGRDVLNYLRKRKQNATRTPENGFLVSERKN